MFASAAPLNYICASSCTQRHPYLHTHNKSEELFWCELVFPHFVEGRRIQSCTVLIHTLTLNQISIESQDRPSIVATPNNEIFEKA
jgi:hypothetical protein